MLDIRLASESAAATRSAAESGIEPDASPERLRIAGGRAGRGLPPGTSTVDVAGLTGERLTAYVEGLVLGAYRFSRRTAAEPEPEVVQLLGSDDSESVARAMRNAAATVWARELTNEPAGTKSPDWLARQAQRELDEVGVAVTVRDEAWLAEQGFGGTLAVGGGSVHPPRLVEANYRPRGAAAGTHVVLVGKGITFDTGGINLKPGDSMRSMHTDMAGGAAVLAALRAVAADGLRVRVTALVPAAENTFGGGSYRPSDVLRHYGGRTSEITNTDAEGRLVLADAMAYAVARLKPTVLVDVATLTGAMKVALGTRTGGLFATSDDLAAGLLAAGERTGEPLWRMPLDDDYQPLLRSDIADAISAPTGVKGLTAALFLRPFAGQVPWAHLDIAGPARATEEDGVIPRGATGFGARLLHAWIASLG